MRRFYLKLSSSTVTKNANEWTSGVIDLYDNNWYTNYSTIKSIYGSNLLGTDVWTGVSARGASPDSSHGAVMAGRYIDYTGQINLVNITVPEDEITLTGTGSVRIEADVYTSPISTASFPSEWTKEELTTPYLDFDLNNTFRYAKFVIRFLGSVGLTVNDANVYVRVEIGPPDISPMFERTRSVLDKFPEWMDIREVNNPPVTSQQYQDYPAVNTLSYSSTPSSLGGRFLNSVSGEWLEELNQQLNYLELQRYIDTVDLTQMAWAYRATEIPDCVYTVTGDGTRLGHAVSLQEFKETSSSEHVYYWDEQTEILYTNKEYTTLTINDVTYAQDPILVWNYLDELGLLVDLRRLHLESNENFRLRILDVHVNRPGVGMDSFKNAIRRELDIWRVYGSDPDSTYHGATPEVLEMLDIESDVAYMTEEGLPTDKFVHLVNWLGYQYPTTWGRFYFDKALWDVAGARYDGYDVLPAILDATPLSNSDTQSGVGDGNDLLVYRPGQYTGPHQFTAKLRARGRHKLTRTEYRTVELPFVIYGQADRRVYANPGKTIWLTIELVRIGSAITYYHSFQMMNTSNVDVNNPISTSTTVYNFLTEAGYTNPDIIWRNKSGDAAYVDASATPNTPTNAMRADQISSITLKHGQWSGAAYVGAESADNFQAWFSHEPSKVVIYNTASNWPTVDSAATPSWAPRPAVVLQSKLTNSTVTKWTSPRIPMTAVINGKLPGYLPEAHVLPVPEIPWDNYLEATPNKEIVIELVSKGPSNTYGGVTHNINNAQVFLDFSYFAVDGNSTWTSNFKKTLTWTANSNITFTVNTGGLYPTSGWSWELVEFLQTGSFTGIVDENGPYRGLTPAEPGNIDFTFANADVTRNSFGIPNNTDYVITWMGIEVTDDPNVLVWLESNTVSPHSTLSDVNDTASYPDNAIVETFSGGVVYAYETIALKARLRPDPPPMWNPQVNSGYFHDEQTEYYLYAKPITQFFSNTASPILTTVPKQGAPIIVRANDTTAREMRQVWAFDDAASPIALSLTNREIISPAIATNAIYLAYPDVYNVRVSNLSTGQDVAGTYNSPTNRVQISSMLNPDDSYLVTYTVNGSFYARNNILIGATPSTQLIFDRSPMPFGGTGYSVSYETSVLNPATPTSVELSPFYSSLGEGFVFISFDEQSLSRVEIAVSPSVVIANGTDYLMITIRSYDAYGNPKPNQSFTLSSTWGTISPSPVTTDKDGSAIAYLTSKPDTTTLTGVITVSGGASATIKFDVVPTVTKGHTLLSVASSEMIPADGLSKVYVFGNLKGATEAPVPSTGITWARARSLRDLFNSPPKWTGGQGQVITDASGNFTVGPFTAATPGSPGYWFVSTTANNAGDVTFWYEYPDSTYGVENLSGLPVRPEQHATPARDAIPMYRPSKYPVQINTNTTATATPPTIFWEPPKWFPLSRYYQYQMGLFGATPDYLAFGSIADLHPWDVDY